MAVGLAACFLAGPPSEACLPEFLLLEFASHCMHNPLCVHLIPYGVPPSQLAQAGDWEPVEIVKNSNRYVNYILKEGEVLHKLSSDETVRRAYRQYSEDSGDFTDDDKEGGLH